MATNEEVVSAVTQISSAVPTATPSEHTDLVPWLTKNVIDYIEQNQLSSFIVIAILAAGLLFAIIYIAYRVVQAIAGLRDTKATSRKSYAEGTKLTLENLKNLHDIEEHHAGHGKRHEELLSGLISALATGKDESAIVSLREQTISHFCNDYLGSLGRYIDYFGVVHGKGMCVRFINAALLKELRTAKRFRTVVNHAAFTDNLKLAPLVLHTSSFDKIWYFCDLNLSKWNRKLWKALECERAEWPADDS